MHNRCSIKHYSFIDTLDFFYNSLLKYKFKNLLLRQRYCFSFGPLEIGFFLNGCSISFTSWIDSKIYHLQFRVKEIEKRSCKWFGSHFAQLQPLEEHLYPLTFNSGSLKKMRDETYKKKRSRNSYQEYLPLRQKIYRVSLGKIIMLQGKRGRDSSFTDSTMSHSLAI